MLNHQKRSMPPRTPLNTNVAGPFITISLSPTAFSKLATCSLQQPLTPVSNVSISPDTIPSCYINSEPIKPSSHTESWAERDIDSTPVFKTEPRKRKRSPAGSRIEPKVLSFHADFGSAPKLEVPIRENSPESPNTSPVSVSKLWQTFDGVNDPRAQRASSTASAAISTTDGVKRSSNRARKLTTKAKELVDTNYLPSLQHTLDQTFEEKQIEERATEAAKSVEIKEDSPVPIEPELTSPTSKEPIPDEKVVQTVEVTETVETVVKPALRTSTRERKPPTWTTAPGTRRAPRKRAASPAEPSRAVKVAKISSASVNEIAIEHTEIIAEDTKTPDEITIPVEPPKVASIQNHDLEAEERREESATPSPNDITVTEESATDSLPKPPDARPSCDLSCLDEVDCLLGFSRVAAHFPKSDGTEDGDSDEDDIDIDAILGKSSGSSEYSNTALESLRTIFCQCAQRGKSGVSAGDGHDMKGQATNTDKDHSYVPVMKMKSVPNPLKASGSQHQKSGREKPVKKPHTHRISPNRELRLRSNKAKAEQPRRPHQLSQSFTPSTTDKEIQDESTQTTATTASTTATDAEGRLLHGSRTPPSDASTTICKQKALSSDEATQKEDLYSWLDGMLVRINQTKAEKSSAVPPKTKSTSIKLKFTRPAV